MQDTLQVRPCKLDGAIHGANGPASPPPPTRFRVRRERGGEGKGKSKSKSKKQRRLSAPLSS
ncbi:hypothetical protein, partial [Stenotrophomonas pavanii]|uniref:hypothetical protein n=1 Tax=Stenotrophomonas pavanii TaxID=487698 RepID=UPI001CA5D865